jgi:hypothetical protein
VPLGAFRDLFNDISNNVLGAAGEIDNLKARVEALKGAANAKEIAADMAGRIADTREAAAQIAGRILGGGGGDIATMNQAMLDLEQAAIERATTVSRNVLMARLATTAMDSDTMETKLQEFTSLLESNIRESHTAILGAMTETERVAYGRLEAAASKGADVVTRARGGSPAQAYRAESGDLFAAMLDRYKQGYELARESAREQANLDTERRDFAVAMERDIAAQRKAIADAEEAERQLAADALRVEQEKAESEAKASAQRTSAAIQQYGGLTARAMGEMIGSGRKASDIGRAAIGDIISALGAEAVTRASINLVTPGMQAVGALQMAAGIAAFAAAAALGSTGGNGGAAGAGVAPVAAVSSSTQNVTFVNNYNDWMPDAEVNARRFADVHRTARERGLIREAA